MRLKERLSNDMYACGRLGLPRQIVLDGATYRLIKTFKHDFFAATGLYQKDADDIGDKIVVKLNRLAPFLGIPLAWLGRWLTRRETRLLAQLADLPNVPQNVKRFGNNGFAYRYIEGASLDEKPALPDDFFDQLENLLGQLHQRGVCYIDLNKRGNILLGADGKPHLIDFQISARIAAGWLGWLRRFLQRHDRYHLLKHKIRLRPDLVSDEQRKRYFQRTPAIWLHRYATKPLRNLRRWCLGQLYRRGILHPPADGDRTPENDPSRFVKRK